jgi:choline dehydrogenase
MQDSEDADVFDYIVVGAGSAGSVVAHRLTENNRNTVCVIEAGPSDRNIHIHIPAGYIKTFYDKSLTWSFESAPLPENEKRKMRYNLGRTLGGSSSINGMIYNRGQHDDYNVWAQRGNRGWSFDEVLAYFRKSEHRDGYADPGYHGIGGPLTVTDPDWNSLLCQLFVDAAKELGLPEVRDYNGAVHEGVGPFQFTIDRSGRQTRRMSTARAFLHPAVKSGRVSVLCNSLVSRIAFDGRKAVGVRYRVGGVRGVQKTVRARREIVVSAGAVSTPRLLQISGIGDPDHLSAIGVPVVAAVPGVGQNLMDHYSIRLAAKLKGICTINEQGKGLSLVWQIAKWLVGRPSILSMGPVPMRLFLRSTPELGRPNLHMTFIPASYNETSSSNLLDDYPGMTCGGYKQRPESRGWVRAVSRDVAEPPELQPNYLSTLSDRDDTVSVFKMARKLMGAKSFARYFETETVPGKDVQTDDEILSFARSRGNTAYHLCGTSKMGPAHEAGAVVDDRLCVHGLGGLRVVDASIMPTITSGNTNAPTIMIAEKASDMMLADASRM